MAPRSHREQLLDGAVECLRTKGYARTTARDIAAAANANLASIGYHYGSKDALLNAAIVRISEEWTSTMAAAAFASQGATPLERMGTSWMAMFATFEEQKPLLTAFMEAAAQAQWSDELREALAGHYRELRDSVGEMVSASLGDDSGADPRAVGSFLVAVFDGFMLQWLLDPEDTPAVEQLVMSLGAALSSAIDQAQA